MIQHRLNDLEVGAVDCEPRRSRAPQVVNPHVDQAHPTSNPMPIIFDRRDRPHARSKAVARVPTGRKDPLIDPRQGA